MIALLLKIINVLSAVASGLSGTLASTLRMEEAINARFDELEKRCSRIESLCTNILSTIIGSEVMRVRLDVVFRGQTITGATTLTLRDNEEFVVTLTAKDAAGNPATFDGAPTYATDRSDLLSVTPSTDGKSATCKALGPLGSCQVTGTIDADLGPAVVPLIGRLDVTIVGGPAVTVTLDAGAPTVQGAPATGGGTPTVP
jgi:hypothetical protein